MATTRRASAVLYLQEELSDARLRTDELRRHIHKALAFVNACPEKDRIHAVCGDILQAVPVCLLKLEKALDAAALASNELDNAELRQELRPEKLSELEAVLDEVRIQLPRRTGLR